MKNLCEESATDKKLSELNDLLKVVPKTFAVDEKTSQALVVFEILDDNTKFSFFLGAGIDVELFISSSMRRSELGFSLAKSIIDELGLEVKKAVVRDTGESEIVELVLLKENKFFKLLEITMVELLGLWSIKAFDIYAEKAFIKKCRDVTVEIKDTKSALLSHQYKKYGQKYLM